MPIFELTASAPYLVNTLEPVTPQISEQDLRSRFTRRQLSPGSHILKNDPTVRICLEVSKDGQRAIVYREVATSSRWKSGGWGERRDLHRLVDPQSVPYYMYGELPQGLDPRRTQMNISRIILCDYKE